MAHAEDMRLPLGLMAALALCLPLAAQTSNHRSASSNRSI